MWLPSPTKDAYAHQFLNVGRVIQSSLVIGLLERCGSRLSAIQIIMRVRVRMRCAAFVCAFAFACTCTCACGHFFFPIKYH